MYFLDLAKFDPLIGHDTDDYNKYPFIKGKKGVFDKFNYTVDDLCYKFPFQRFDVEANKCFYVSEKNIRTIFSTNPKYGVEIEIDRKVDDLAEYIKNLKADFFNGYEEGHTFFKKELGVSFPHLSIEEKKATLINLIDQTQEFLFFEGFAIPSYLYNLGYLQACLVFAVKELIILNSIYTQKSSSSAHNSPAVLNEQVELYSGPIEILGDSEKIIALWSLLILGWDKTKLNVSFNIRNEESLKEFLSHFFIFPETRISDVNIKNTKELFDINPEDDSLFLINFLIHATSKINKRVKNKRLSIKDYCKVFWEKLPAYNLRYEDLDSMYSNVNKGIEFISPYLKAMRDKQEVKIVLENIKNIETYKRYLKD